MHRDNQILCCIKEATPQNRPNYSQDMAVRGAVGDLAGNSQVHLLGFIADLKRLNLLEKEARTANKGFAKMAGEVLNLLSCASMLLLCLGTVKCSENRYFANPRTVSQKRSSFCNCFVA